MPWPPGLETSVSSLIRQSQRHSPGIARRRACSSHSSSDARLDSTAQRGGCVTTSPRSTLEPCTVSSRWCWRAWHTRPTDRPAAIWCSPSWASGRACSVTTRRSCASRWRSGIAS
ncbi:hypothetical protein ACFPRL_25580 [Pseudoclavibacter helvolus]